MILLALALALVLQPAPGYPPGDVRCALAYQRETGWEFIDDDAPNCPGLRAYLRHQQRRDRMRLCRQEQLAAREGLIGTAPTNEEAVAEISETNPTPMCRKALAR